MDETLQQSGVMESIVSTVVILNIIMANSE